MKDHYMKQLHKLVNWRALEELPPQMSKFFCHTPLCLIRRGHFQVRMFAQTIRPLYSITLTGEVTANIPADALWIQGPEGYVARAHANTHISPSQSTNEFIVPPIIHFLSASVWKLLYTVLRLLLFFPLVNLKERKKSFKRVISFLPHWHFKAVFEHWEQCSWT